MDGKDGKLLVKLSRRAISEYLMHGKVIKAPTDINNTLKEKRGVFVTLTRHPQRELRGCIGLPEPAQPLSNAIIDAAISSATRDPRFDPVSPDELSNITIEVTILTPPELIHTKIPRDCLDMIEIGRHGLTIESGGYRGLLLPQVPVEQGWGGEEYLACLCAKAGLQIDAWTKEDTKICRFEGVIFSELYPDGDVIRKDLN